MKIPSELAKVAFDRYVALAMSIHSRWPLGTNVFDLDWDALIILDTCRIDALRDVASEYDFLDDIEAITSVGSTSSEWIASTFVEDYQHQISDCVYVSANGFDQPILCENRPPEEGRGPAFSDWKTVGAGDLLNLDQVWKYAPEPMHGHVRPEHVTDRAIANARKRGPDRLIVHYSQPHEPYTADADAEGREELYDYELDPWEFLNDGGDYEVVWDSYLNNLRMVLDEVEKLLENVDAEKVAISADHGEAFGEWGVNRHPIAVPHPKVRRVPWATTTAKDLGDYEPTLEQPTNTRQSRDVEQHLSNLGYR